MSDAAPTAARATLTVVRARVRALPAALVLLLVTGCASAGGGPRPGVSDIAGEWRGRWLGPAGHALAALSIEPTGAYRARMFLDGGDRDTHGVIVALPSGRLRYQGGDGNGEVRMESGAKVTTLRFAPDGGGGGGAFQRAP
jgi:hypothetical protein